MIPRTDFTWPWAVIPPLGFALAGWLAERYRDRLRDRDGWRGKVGIFYDAVHLVFEMLSHPRRYGYAVAGMLVYWAGDIFALWAATAAFGFHMTVLAVIVAFGTGMLFTRRTARSGVLGSCWWRSCRHSGTALRCRLRRQRWGWPRIAS